MSCPCSLPAIAGMLSSAIAQGRSDDEIALLSALFTQIGDSLALILAAKVCSASTLSATPSKSQPEEYPS